MPTMLILGANSGIARATALRLADDGWNLILAGRDLAQMEKNAADVAIRSGRKADAVFFDANGTSEEHSSFWEALSEKVDSLFCAIGLISDRETPRHDLNVAQRILTTNFTGLVPILAMVADTFEQRGRGSIAVISSVAGDRGRASNYTYGSAKAGLTAYLSGLRQRLTGTGVEILTIKAGWVDTAMTEGVKLPRWMVASPQKVAGDIVAAINGRRTVLYTPWFWRWIMISIRITPEAIFRRIRNF